jgi:hypothetical protein
MSEQQPQYEKDEKTREQDEKNRETHEKELEKREEKTVEEKWRRDPLGAVIWAAILIWAGLVFLAENMGWLENIRLKLSDRVPNIDFIHMETWTIVVLGAGVIVLIEVAIRLLVPSFRQPLGGTLILAAVFFGIGLGNIFGWEIVWPLVVIAVGLGILLGGFTRRRRVGG